MKKNGSAQADSTLIQKPVVRLPIRLKITLPFVLMAVIMAIGASYVLTQVIFDTIDERFNNQLIEVGKLGSEWMMQEETRLLETLRLEANADGVAEALLSANAERLRTLSLGVAVNNQEEAVEFLDRRGNLLLSMHHVVGGRVEEYTFTKDGDDSYLDFPFVAKVVEGSSDPSGNKYAGVILGRGGDYFYVSGPIYDRKGQFAGVVMVGKTLSTLVTQLREKTLAQVSLYDMKGMALASTLPVASSARLDQVSLVLSRQDDASFRRSMDSRRQVDILNIGYEEIMGVWEARDDEDFGVIGLAMARSFLVNMSRVTRMRMGLMIGLALLFILVMGILIANYITRPLLGLVAASERVKQGDLSVEVPPTSQDEVALLADSFNRMVRSLNQSQTELMNSYDSTLDGWAHALELRDKETEGHTRRVAALAVELAHKMGVGGDQLVQLRRGALLHDIGKMGVPDSILLKPGTLTDDERTIIQQHPLRAYELLYPIEYLRPALDIPYCHHEWWDGNGYPRGLKGNEIPLSARIFAVVDGWDAMINDRYYRRAVDHAQAIAQIQQGSGTQFDPQVVDVFVKMMNEQDLTVKQAQDESTV